MGLIKELYAAFADVPKPSQLKGCQLGCCMPKEDENTLLGQTLKHSDPELLYHYIMDAIWTVGTKQDFKYYIPRLLELGLTEKEYSEGGNFISFPETFGKKLALADFDDWSDEKQSTVDDAIFHIMTEEALKKDFFSFEGWMVAICHISLDKKRYLDFLDSEDGAEARDSFLVTHRDTYKHGRMKGPFWDELDVENTTVIYNWLALRKEQSDIALGKDRRRKRAERELRRN